MVNYIFKFHDNNFKYNDNATPSTADTKLLLNMDSIMNLEKVSLMNREKAKERLRNDMYKDADYFPPIDDKEKIIKETFELDPPTPPSSYKQQLSNLDKAFSPAGHEKNYFNIIKTSTGGPDPMKYQLTATNILHESGMKPNKISNASKITVITTPAARLDPASKTGATDFFPDDSTSITFDSSFTSRLGFPHELEWTTTNKKSASATASSSSAEPLFDVTISNNKFKLDAIDLKLTKKSSTPSKLEEYSLAGNKKKNTEINNLWNEWNKTKDDKKKLEILNEIYKFLLLKELGDVVQVFLYYALIVIKTIGVSPEDFLKIIKTYLMITTDSIVYFLCKAFELPAAYSGSRTKVESGHCTLRYFLIGDADFKAHLINLFEIEYNKILGHNTSIKTVLEKIINIKGPTTNLKIFNFHIKLPSNITVEPSRETKSYYASNTPVAGNIFTLNGNHLINQASKSEKDNIHNKLKERLSELVADIDKKNEALKEYYNKKIEEFKAIDSKTLTSIEDVTTRYDEFQKHMQETMKCEQYITILPQYNKGVRFIFNDTSKLFIPDIKFKINLIKEEFAFELSMIPKMITDATFTPLVDAVAAAAAAAEGSSQIASPVNVKSGGTPNSDAEHYEHLLMYFVYTFFFNNQKIIELNIDEKTFSQELFATYYDMFVWKCEKINWRQRGKPSETLEKIYIDHFNTIFDKIPNEQIQEYGEILSKYINFYHNKNTDIELKKVLETELESETPVSSSSSEKLEGGPDPSTPDKKNKFGEPVSPQSKQLVTEPLTEPVTRKAKSLAKSLDFEGPKAGVKKSRKRGKRSKKSKRNKRGKRSKRSKKGKRTKKNKEHYYQ